MRKPPKQVLFACIGVAAAALYAWPFSIDDAYITARYGRRIVGGAGYTFNDGPATDGVTGPLWLLPMLASEVLSFPALTVAKVVSILCVVLASAWAVAQVRARVLGNASAWVAALICVTSMPLVVWSVAGLETGAACLAFVAMASWASAARATPRVHYALGAAIGSSAWLRPELALAAACALALVGLRDRRGALRALSVAMVFVSALLGFRFLLFDHLLPLSAFAKPSELGHGVRYVLSAFFRTDVACASALMVYAVVQGTMRDRALFAMLAAHVLACVLAGGDWMPARRLLVPMVPVVATLVGLGFSRLRLRHRVLAWGLLGGALFFSTLESVRELSAARAAGVDAPRKHAEMITELRKRPGPIAILDVGAVGYALDEEILDLGGLTSNEVAYLQGGHLAKSIRDAWLRARAPSWVVLHSTEPPRITRDGQLATLVGGYPVEQRVARLPYVREHCSAKRVLAFAPRYHYVFLACSGAL